MPPVNLHLQREFQRPLFQTLCPAPLAPYDPASLCSPPLFSVEVLRDQEEAVSIWHLELGQAKVSHTHTFLLPVLCFAPSDQQIHLSTCKHMLMCLQQQFIAVLSFIKPCSHILSVNSFQGGRRVWLFQGGRTGSRGSVSQPVLSLLSSMNTPSLDASSVRLLSAAGCGLIAPIMKNLQKM